MNAISTMKAYLLRFQKATNKLNYKNFKLYF